MLTKKALMFLLFMPFAAGAQGYQNSRANSWDFSVGGMYQTGSKDSGDNGSYLDVDDALGFGLNIAYNFNNHFSLGADFDFLQPDYKAVLVDNSTPLNSTTIDHYFSQFNSRFKATYNFLDGPWVPFIEAGAGWTYVDSNVADGPPITGCWWHPWWGYICSNYYDTFSDTGTTYGGNIGVRYEFVGNSFLKASYSRWEVDIDGAEPELESFRIDYGWRF
jgi:opacity protein-like surface antigen